MTIRSSLVLVPAATAASLALAACSGLSAAPDAQAPMAQAATSAMAQAMVPAPVQVPDGHAVALETVGVGEITYECRAPTGAATVHQWVFVGPRADLNSKSGAKLGSYFGPPATWASTDGSRITGKQLAVAPGAAGSIPLQLVQANPAEGQGAMTGVTYVQRLNTRGGVAPATPCDAGAVGQKQVVKYQADYIFWKAV